MMPLERLIWVWNARNDKGERIILLWQPVLGMIAMIDRIASPVKREWLGSLAKETRLRPAL